ncbi:major facilitator superfamily MFS_1 [Catenulispora acidiphila DSM 44928]|uniref:Major facilitator superfamily MFS_1 n=1 Tax=Catenulispora acidiphila (strain DSM 44928 / JCM 14897 / NBRC 102108 / NRRL B-24433 / ID139908) TaxID=479433 RepID=C7PY03_CATAD|nr:MFS transporter [Catenulispora acidiphila]ACU73463.1 major facilitator superfamily MFS_1 [Catenulispora acidiphila DSM 44928]
MTSTMSPAPRRPDDIRSTAPLLRNRPYQAVSWSQTCTDFAEQFLIVAITWAAVHTFGGDRLGLVLAAWAVPRGLLLLFGGVLADRKDRRAVGVAVGMLLCLLNLSASVVTGRDELWAWLALAVCLGVLDAVRLPLGSSLLPLIVGRERLVEANRWVSLREWGAMTGGPALGGALVALLGTGSTLITAAVMYALSSILLAQLPSLRPDEEQPREPVLVELSQGLAIVLRHRQLRTLLLAFALANLFILGLVGVGIPLFAKEVLKAGPQGLGVLAAAFGAGLVLGTLLCHRLPDRWQRSQQMIFALFMLSDCLLAVVGLAPNLLLAAAAYGASGLVAGPPATYYRALLQTLPPAEYLGRVTSIARATSFGLEPASTAGVGALSARLSARTLFVVGGCAAAVVDLIGLTLSRHRNREN